MSIVLSNQEMIDLESQAFDDRVDAWELMLDAGRQMADAVRQFCLVPGRCMVFVGKGNNGGDALVTAKYLQTSGWEVEVRLVYPPGEMSLLARRALRTMPVVSDPLATEGRGRWIILDGLLGLGAQGPLRSPVKEAVAEINKLREQRGAVVFALDLPSGLEGDPTKAVMADHTLTVGHAKAVLLADVATDRVGRLSVLPLDELPVVAQPGDEVAVAEDLRMLLPRRSFDRRKGQSGRVGIVGGSTGTTGAVVMAALGALRAGAGLVTVYCPQDVYALVVSQMPPEVMVHQWEWLEKISGEQLDVLAIGPGLSPKWRDDVEMLVQEAVLAKVSLVLDAGALAIFEEGMEFDLAAHPKVLLTPHPGELERFFPQDGRTRAEWARQFVKDEGMTLLLKGARTVVAERRRPLSYNSTGHPGMATGGMGDTLTGVCAALIGQGLAAYDAARLGAWVCGRAAEIAIWEDGLSQESLLPSDLALRLGRAFSDCRQGVW